MATLNNHFIQNFVGKKRQPTTSYSIHEINCTMTNRQILTFFFDDFLRSFALRPLAANYLNQYVEQIIRALCWIDHEEFLRDQLKVNGIGFDESKGEEEKENENEIKHTNHISNKAFNRSSNVLTSGQDHSTKLTSKYG